ncbi:hypothetical protein CWI36_0526p0020, partial [Hamiltosporidium magnivora]
MGKEVKSEENGERRRIATFFANTCTLSDTTVYINLRDKLFSKTKEISEKEIEKVEIRTRKNPNKLVDSKVLDLINRVVCEYAKAHVPNSISETAYIMQAAQVCYDEATPLPFGNKKLYEIMREFNLNLSSVTDLSEALVKKNESLNVYEKKITMHESRKQFRKENRMFELFRGRFYRGLSERVKSEHVVSSDEIVSFWSTMWNKNTDTVTYENYLIPFVSDNHPTMFLLLDEFVNIINWLPNWKAAGIDEVATNYTCCEDTGSLLEGVAQTSKDLKDFANFSKLDDAVRAVLVKNKIHLRPGCKERLYLPRTELGRGLHSVELRSENMLLQLLDCLEKCKKISTRRAELLKVENNNNPHLALIKGFLKVKYRLVEEVTKKKQEILDNEYAEIRVDTRIKTDITLIEVGITSQYSLQIVETEKLRKYDLLANELGLIYKCSVEIIPYV